MNGDRLDRLDSERRELLVRTSAREFASMGFERASLNRIIHACGLSKSSFYHYIPSKRHLFDLVVQDLSSALLAALDIPEPEAFAGDDFWPEFERLSERLSQISQHDDAFVALGRMFYLSGLPAEENEALTASMGAIEAWLRDVLMVGRRSGVVREDLPVSLQSRLVFAVARTLDEWTLVHADEFSPEEARQLALAELACVRRMLEPDRATERS